MVLSETKNVNNMVHQTCTRSGDNYRKT